MSDGARDGELAGLAAKGDRRAMTRLYEMCSERVYSLIRRMCGNDALAADLSQEAWVRALEGIERFDGRVPFCGWVGAIARNLVIDEFRRRKPAFQPHPDEEVTPTAVTNPPQRWIIERIELQRCLDALPDGYRTILILKTLEGFRHSEIAERLGIDPGTSRSQFHKARARMTRCLEQGADARTAAPRSG